MVGLIFRLIKVFYVCAFIFIGANADYKSGKKIFEQKCSSCHLGYISGKILKNNFYEKDNKLLKLKAPTVNMIVYDLINSPLHLGDKNDPEMQKVEVLDFITSYVYNPKLENSVSDTAFSKYYDKKKSMNGKVSEDELSQITDYFFEYKKMRLKEYPKVEKFLKDPKDFMKVMQQANDENKVIILEAMSTTCVYCREMKDNVFSLSEVQKAINKNFIFVELDIDKTKLPLGLDRNYKGLTPTFFFITKHQRVLHIYPGSWNKDDFLEILNENLQK